MSNTLKRKVAAAALEYVKDGTIIGVGTGSTADAFIDLLGESRLRLEGAVASSEKTAKRLADIGVDVLDLNMTGDLALYIDGADEVDPAQCLIKGGGGALTREKIVAAASRQFICIVDHTKCVDVLGDFSLPVEVIPMARSYVARQLVELGGDPEYREAARTDNGNMILDVYNLRITEPQSLEKTINNIAGVVTNGLFALRPADIVLVSQTDGTVITQQKN